MQRPLLLCPAHPRRLPCPRTAQRRRSPSLFPSRLAPAGLCPSPAPSPRAPIAALALPAGPAEAACALCQRAPREPVLADCGHRFCRACVVRFWAEEDGPFPCPECADDCWQRAVEPGRPPLSRRLLALEEAAAAPARDGPASEAALQLLCRVDSGPLCSACRMAAGPEPPEWEPRWRKALRGKVRAGGVLCAALPFPTRIPAPVWCPEPHHSPGDGALFRRPSLLDCPIPIPQPPHIHPPFGLFFPSPSLLEVASGLFPLRCSLHFLTASHPA